LGTPPVSLKIIR